MFWFRPWRHHHMWRHHRPMGCGPLGCLWVLLLPLFFCLAWAFLGVLTRMLWW